MMKKVFAIVLAFVCFNNLYAEGIDAYALLRKVQATYTSAVYLRFDLKYIASMATSPNQQFDSLHGSMAIHDKNYRLVLGASENVVNDKHMFQVFNEDKILLVGNRPTITGNAAMPILALDSNSFKQKGFTLSATKEGSIYKMIISFPEGLSYKAAELYIDVSSGYILQARYSIKTEAMVEKDAMLNANKAGGGLANAYSIVTVLYSHYSTQPFDTAFFQDNHFVSNAAGDLKAAGAYEGYQIFNVNPKQF